MRLGFTVPQFGPNAGPDALLEVARLAEDLGYDSLWVFDRLLYPLNPKRPTRRPPTVRCRFRTGARSILCRSSRTSRRRRAGFGSALATTPDGHQAVAITPCYCGPIEEGERILTSIRAFGSPIADLIRPMKYSEMNTLLDAANSPGMQNYWKGNLLRELGDGAIDAIVEHAARVSSPRTVILIDQLHEAAKRVAPSEAAFAHRDTRHNVMTMSMWEDPADAETNIAWTRGLSAAIEPFASGVYVNGAYEQRPFAAYGANYDRLVEIKSAYDPTNFFRHNQNIRPKAQSLR